ncbi:MAG: hypothetical protein K2F89_02170, partial [Treponemataceae bacterium]|nr:hypothetical protein [Treponemataceae bacterium]
ENILEGDNPSTSEAGVFSLQATHFPQHGSGLPPQDPAFGHRNHEFVVTNSFTAFDNYKFGATNSFTALDRNKFGATNSFSALDKNKFGAPNSLPAFNNNAFCVTNSFTAFKEHKFGATNTSAGLLARVSTIPKPIAAYAGRNKIAKGASL